MKTTKISVDFLLTIVMLPVACVLLFVQPWVMLPLLVAGIGNMIIGTGIVTMLDQRVEGRLTLWLTDRPVQWLSVLVIMCWPALMWIYRERRLQPVRAPKR